MSISSDIRSKERAIKNLEKYKRDLTDDTGDITAINRLVGDLQSDFQSAVVADNTRSVVDKINNLIEPYQSSDSDITTAEGYIDTEISALRREIAALERALEAARSAKAALNGN